MNLASVHLARKDSAAAEALIRQALQVRMRAPDLVPSRRRMVPEDDWSVGAAKSLLGAALAGLARYDEAEAMLLEAHRDLEAGPGPQGRAARATVARLVALYDAWGKPEKAAPYRCCCLPEHSLPASSFPLPASTLPASALPASALPAPRFALRCCRAPVVSALPFAIFILGNINHAA